MLSWMFNDGKADGEARSMGLHILKRVGILVFIAATSACSLTAPAAPTSTPTVTLTATPTASTTPTATLTLTASATPTITPTATITPSPTITPIPSNTPLPSSTPGTVTTFTLDNWELLELPAFLAEGLPEPYVVFLNLNNRDSEGLSSTPQPGTGVQSLYFSPSANRANRIKVLQLPESTGNQVYIAPAGNGVAYFIESGSGTTPGLYLLDLQTSVAARVLPIDTLVQRGFFSEPAWATDGSQLALMLATEYATDIFLISRDGAAPRNITNSGAYDLFPAFSPDGRYLAFVSDREVCPTWIPDQPETCDRTDTPTPDGGHLYALELATGDLQKLSEVWLTEPPRWINNTRIAYTEGQPLFGDTERSLWFADVIAGTSRRVPSIGGGLMLAESWSPNGKQVFYQSAGSTTRLVIADTNGDLVAEFGGFNYPRYGVAASWSPDGSRLALGGVNGQCPFGSTVFDALDLSFIARSNPPPSMCSPLYAPDGASIAYTGVSLNAFDGRADIYVANLNGFGTVNLTGDLRGTMTLLGWAGANP